MFFPEYLYRIVREHFTRAPRFRCYGVTVSIDSDLTEILDRLGPALVPASQICDAGRADLEYFLKVNKSQGRYSASVGSQELIQTADLNCLLEFLKLHVQRAVAERAREYVFIHAGAVAWGGEAILLPGRSGSGKSTLVRELISSGAEYLSDEYAVLDEDGFAHPFARPLSIRTAFGRAICQPHELGAETITHPVPVAAVVFSRYKPGRTFRPARLTPGRAMLEVLDNVVAVRSNPAKSIRVARSVTSESLVLRSLRGEAASTATAIIRLMTSIASGRNQSDRTNGGTTCTHLPGQQG